ncbi:60S ribosomal protein L4-1 [Camellia lanceoleosa]|nr:60S ribosomal protein L4-1 [Camellia lanceoleosa]
MEPKDRSQKAFRNIPGVEIANVERLNLLKLAPGGHVDDSLSDQICIREVGFGLWIVREAFGEEEGHVLPRAKMVNADLTRIINSDEVQSVVRPIKKEVKRAPMKKNPLKNLNTMLKLNPYAKTAKRMALLAEAQRLKSKKEKLDKKRKQISKEEATKSKSAGKAWYLTMISDSDYTEFENFSKWLGVSQ